MLGRRGFALESAAARVCREAGGRVATNILVRDLDLGTPDARDARRLEVVVDGLPLFGGAQLAVDTTLVSAIQGNGEPRNGAAERDGVALAQAKRTRPSRGSRPAGGVGIGNGWSLVQGCAHICAVACTGQVGAPSDSTSSGAGMAIDSVLLAASLQELRGGRGADGQVSQLHDVEREFCNAGLSA